MLNTVLGCSEGFAIRSLFFKHAISIWKVLFASLYTLLSWDTFGAEQRNLLLLYSYHPTFHSTAKVHNGLAEQLEGLNIRIDIEFMDSKRSYDDQSVIRFHDLLAYKLKDRDQYDYVVTADDNALHFALDYHDEMFYGLPIVFLGINDIDFATQQNMNPLVTGTVERASFSDNIDLIKDIFPNNRTIHVITDGTTSGHADLISLQQTISHHGNLNWNIIDLSNIGWQTLEKQLGTYNNGVIMLVSAYKDKNSAAKSFNESLLLIKQASNIPIIHPYEHGMGDGVLGGVMVSHTQQAKVAGSIIQRLTQGDRIADIPVIEQSPNIAVFDARELESNKVRYSKLPADAHVLFREKSLVEQHSDLIIVCLLIALATLAAVHGNRYLREKQLKESEHKLRLILDTIQSYIYLKDEAGRYLFANKSLRDHLDKPLEEIVGKTAFELYPYQTAKQISKIDIEVMRTLQPYSSDEHHLHNNDSTLTFHTDKVPLIDSQSNMYALCGVSTDVTRQKAQYKMLEQAAYYDALTGLPNRIHFIESLTREMEAHHASENTLCLAFFDIDDFSEINNLHGHTFGDELLQLLFMNIKQFVICMPIEMARVGGDEFYLLFQSTDVKETLIDSILELIQRPIRLNGIEVHLSASCGISYFPQENHTEPEQFIRQSEHALFIAKHRGPGQVQVYQQAYDSNVDSELKQELSDAFVNNEFVLHFQPKVNLSCGDVVGVEALVRWQHPKLGVIYPGQFLSDVESLGYMKRLDDWVMRTALEQLNTWYQADIHLPMSINLSNEYFKQANIEKIILDKLAIYPNLPPKLFEIEIVENSAIESLSQVAEIMESLKPLGINFSLDDFGTGYSSLAYLQKLPVNVLKVDRSFIINMRDNKKDLHILIGILGFCKAFGLKSIAEGVESLEHAQMLKEIGYDIIQGFGISKPLPNEKLLEWLYDWNKNPIKQALSQGTRNNSNTPTVNTTQ